MEIFAPAGNFESMLQAVQNGADCVYLGVDAFNARMKADNFTKDTLSEAVKLCHLFDVKVYLTLNILVKPKEFQEALDVASFAYNSGVDGIISADYGLTAFLAKNLKGCDISFSTQANIQNKLGCQQALALGVKSVVLSREIDRETIKSIRNACPDISLEYFVQGALCVCVSGQCQMSSAVDVYSGNRGRCKQPCRQYYTAYENGKKLKEGYLLSPKDLSLADKIDDLRQLGINRVKIEGRNRRKEYVGKATSVYRKALDGKKISAEDIIGLKKMFNRGDYTSGYMYTKDVKDLMSPDLQGHKGVLCGTVSKITDKFLFAKTTQKTNKGDAYKIIRVGKEVGSAVCVECGGNTLKASYSGKIKIGDDVYITSDSALLSCFEKFTSRLPVDLSVVAFAGNAIKCVCHCKNVTITVHSDFICQQAEKQPLSEQEIASQLSKFGDTYFTISDIVVKTDNIFVAKSQLNEFRRKIASQLFEYLTRSDRTAIGLAEPKKNKKQGITGRMAAVISDPSQAAAVKECDIIIVKPAVYSKEFLAQFDLSGFYLDLPNFALESDIRVLESLLGDSRIHGISANSLYAISLAERYNKKLLLAPGMNIFNDHSVARWSGSDCDFVYSNELSLSEIDEFANQNGYIYAEGNIRCMTLAHCPVQLTKNCHCANCKYQGDIVYKDKLNNEFIIRRKVVSKCYFEVINSHRLSSLGKISPKHNFYLNLCGMTRQESQEIIRNYKNYISRGLTQQEAYQGKTTNGHLFKKVK